MRGLVKKTSKQIKLLGLLVILILTFLFAFNVTYSYFTATANVAGNIEFANLDVRFAYRSNNVDTLVDSDTLTVYPSASTGTIARGSTIYLATEDGDDIQYLAFNSSIDSTSSYIRYRINAYKVEDGTVDTSENFGQYFEFQGSIDVTRRIQIVGGETNAIYYIEEEVAGNVTRVFASSIKLLETAPVSLLNSQINLTITFEAVQSENQAYLAIFNDGWGYLESWT